MSEENENKPWIDILLDAAREAGFANKISAHELATFSLAIRLELGNRRMSTFEAEQYADEMENATVDYFRSSTATNWTRFFNAKTKLIRALTGTTQKDKET